jgi:cell division transport system permease protein
MKKPLFYHQQAIRHSWQQLRYHPWSNFFTMAVIGIAIALPVILSVILSNVQEMTRGWDVGNQVSIFLKDTTSFNQAQQLANQLKSKEGVEKVDYFSREDTLEEFREYSGFAEALELLPENPLPAVIVIHPKPSLSNTQLEAWAKELERLPTVELVQLDQEWLQRLGGLMQVANRGILILSILLLIAVGLVIGNTIRLLIENRQEEISLITLIGANSAFVRRPFLYSGLWFGLGGGLLACILVGLGLLLLQQPTADLAKLYNSSFMLSNISFLQMLKVLILSMIAGCASAYVVVSHYLYKLSHHSAI